MTTFEAVGGSFDFGRVVQRTFRVIGDNLVLFAVSALILVSLPIFIATIAGLAGGTTASIGLSAFVGGLLAAVGSFILQGVIISAAIETLSGRSIQTREAIGVGARFILPLFGLGIMQALGIGLGFLLLFVPGLILCVMWSVSAPALVTEKRGVFAGMQRSRDLTRGHRWPIFGLLVVFFVLSIVLSVVIQALSVAIGVSANFGGRLSGPMPFTAPVAISALISSLNNGLQAVIGAGGAAAIYFELRSAKEGVAPEQTAAVFD